MKYLLLLFLSASCFGQAFTQNDLPWLAQQKAAVASGGGTDPGTPNALWAKTDETSGTVVNDSSTAANNGTVGTAAWVAGPFSNAINVAGTGGKSAQFTTVSAYTFASDFYISLWVNSVDASHFSCLVELANAAQSGVFLLIDLNSSGQPIVNNGSTIITGTAVNDGTWHNIILARVSGVFTLYQDNVSKGTTSSASTYPSPNPLVSIGAKVDSSSPAFCKVADYRVSAQTFITANGLFLQTNK